jgi:hypothetical protein
VLLALIPFVCVYVDLLCSHQWLQIHVIAAFLRRRLDTYERFIEDQRKEANAFALEKWALYGSTILLCIGTAILGYMLSGASVEPKYWWILPLLFGVLSLMLSVTTIRYNETVRYEELARRSEQSKAFALEKWALYGVTMLLWLATAALASPIFGVSANREPELWLILGAATVGLALSFLTMGYFYGRLNKIRAIDRERTARGTACDARPSG